MTATDPDYPTLLASLSGRPLVNELKQMIGFHQQFPDDAEGKDRHDACREHCKRIEGGAFLWALARRELEVANPAAGA